MDGDDAPGSLHAELFKEGRGDDGVAADKGVRVQQTSADYADEDDAEAPSEALGAVADDGTASHGAEVGHDLSDSHSVGRLVVLVLQHRRVQILGAVRL